MTDDDRIKLEPGWKAALRAEFDQPYMHKLREFLREEYAAGKEIYPPGPLIFNALNSTPLDKVKVVILGQDPYHGPGQAHGLCFGAAWRADAAVAGEHLQRAAPRPQLADSQPWLPAKLGGAGVLLLNTTMTVQRGNAASHANAGWQPFTDRVIQVVSEQCENVVFLLWGSHAQSKQKLIDGTRHLVLKSVHPSPLSAYRGFFGCGHFSRTNSFLEQRGLAPINWSLPPL